MSCEEDELRRDHFERVADTIVISFPTTVDYVVNLATGEVKREFEGEVDFDSPSYASSWSEGELLGESIDGTQSGFGDGDDRTAYLKAMTAVRTQEPLKLLRVV